jgi:hypothetical protein
VESVELEVAVQIDAAAEEGINGCSAFRFLDLGCDGVNNTIKKKHAAARAALPKIASGHIWTETPGRACGVKTRDWMCPAGLAVDFQCR